MIKKYKNRIKEYFREMLELKTSPHSISMGFAIGTFIALLPTFGITYIIAFIVMLAYPKANKISIIAALIFWNPLFLIPIYTLSFEIGDLLLQEAPTVVYDIVFYTYIQNISRRFLLGNLIVASFFSLCSYIFMRIITEIIKMKRQREDHKKVA